MDDPDVIWVTHPSFRVLSDDYYSAIIGYFETDTKSGGGEVTKHRKVVSGNGEPTALLIQFRDIHCIQRVTSQKHRLVDIFGGDKFSPGQVLEVKVHSIGTNEVGELASKAHSPSDMQSPTLDTEQSWVVLDSMEEGQQPTMKLEIFEYPDDVIISELVDHFVDTFQAQNRSTEEQITERFQKTQVYTLEFLQTDAERILEKPEQWLDSGDEDTKIKIRPAAPPIRAVLFHSDTKINTRMVKKSLKNIEIASCEMLADSKHDVIVVFKNPQDAQQLVAGSKLHKISSSITTSVSLYQSVTDAAAVSPDRLKNLTVDDDEERPDTPMSTNSASSSMTLDMSVEFEPQSQPCEGTKNKTVDRQLSSRTLTPSPLTLGNELQNKPPKFEEEERYTYIEILKSVNESAGDVYEILKLHFESFFGEEWKATKQIHSYDEHKKVYRFEMNSQDIKRLMAAGPQYFDEDDTSTVVEITPHSHESCICVRVQSNPGKKTLTEAHLKEKFGQNSQYRNQMQILKLDKSAGALIQMENPAVAALIVSGKTHQLPNKMVLMATFDLTLSNTSPDSRADSRESELQTPTKEAIPKAENKAVLVTFDEKLSDILLKKYIKSVKGTVRRIDEQNIVIDFENAEDATKMLEQEQVEILRKKGAAVVYKEPEPTPVVPTDLPTHVEIKCKLAEKENPEDVYTLIEEHLLELLGEWTSTKLEHSYDQIKQLFRFDMSPEDISLLTSSKQMILEDTPDSELQITPKKTGKTVVIKSLADNKDRLSKTQVKSYLGPKSSIKSTMAIQTFTDQQAILELQTCSVASKVVAMKTHELRNGCKIEISFPYEENNNSDSESEDEEKAPDQSQERAQSEQDKEDGPWKRPGQQRNAALSSLQASGSSGPAGRSGITKEHETLLVYNLLDVDEETLSYWVRSVTGLWPTSIHMSDSEDKAIIKVPLVGRGLDNRDIQRTLAQNEYNLHGEKLRIERITPSTAIQVLVSTKSSQPIHNDVLEGYFGNPRYTGVSSTGSIDVQSYDQKQDVFIITYPTENDVRAVLNRKPHRHAGNDFDVAEFYAGVGMCKPRGLILYSPLPEGNQNSIGTSLSVSNIPKKDLDTLKLKMANRRVRGGDIDNYITNKSRAKGLYNVKISYKEESVAERVYTEHRKKPIYLNETELNIELESPALLDYHDNMSVRLSELTPDLDPEKLKFYISALSGNIVTEVLFDGSRTKAIAQFSQPLDFGMMLCQHYNVNLAECPDLRLQQENKPAHILAVGQLSKDNIELTLEDFLGKALKGQNDIEIDICAEQMENATDKWKIDVGSEVLGQVKLRDIQHQLKGCTQLTLFSEHLGLNVTTGAYKKTKPLSEIITDQRMLEFLLNGKYPGFEKLSKHLKDHGFTMTSDGSITVLLTNDKKKNRRHLQNWRTLNQCVEKYIRAHCLVFETESLTEQVFAHMARKVNELTKSLKVICKVISGKTSHQPGVNKISVTGERATIENLQVQIVKQIKEKEKHIQDEQNVKAVVIPNIRIYQVEYLERVGFFKDMITAYRLKDIVTDKPNEMITITGLPSAIEEVQKKMLDILPKVEKSRVSDTKKPLFLKVFKESMAVESLEKEFLNRRVVAVWTLENKTVTMYSESKDKARIAMDCLNDVIWEAQYPQTREFDDLEKRLLSTPAWRGKQAELIQNAPCLQIVQFGDKPGLSLAGLKYTKGQVLEEIPMFFEQNVIRTESFIGRGKRMSFITKFDQSKMATLSNEFSVQINTGQKPEELVLSGTTNAIANVKRALASLHDKVVKDEYTVDSPAMVQHIKDDKDLLENVGLRTKCLVTIHEEEEAEPMEITQDIGRANIRSSDGEYYTTAFPSGVTCSVIKGDVTKLKCDAIVNAANGDLDHCGGLAYAVVRAGGDAIQQECKFYIRRHGKLMEGQVMTSDPGALPCKKIIHAVGPRWNNGRSDEEWNLGSCIENCLEELRRQGLNSIAIPPISTGIFGFPMDLAVKTIVKTICDLDKKGNLPRKIYLIDNKDDSLRCFARELRSYTEAMKPKAPPAARPRASKANDQPVGKPGKYTIKGKTLTILQRVNLEIVSGDITNRQEDTLVNSVGKDMNLSNGKVAPVILSKAGPQLQAECTNLGPIQPGEVKGTDGYQMPCKRILHCCLPDWSGPASLQALQQIVNECLTQAAAQEHTTIAFPALGTGNLKYPEQNVAKCMIDTVVDYTEKNPRSSIRDVKIVIYHLDQRTQQGFDAVLSKMETLHLSSNDVDMNLASKQSRGPSRSGNEKAPSLADADVVGGIQVSDTFLRVVKGSITEHNADIIVNSTDDQLSMRGMVARALLEKGGRRLQDEINSLAGRKTNNGIWVTSAGGLDAKHIIHLDTTKPGKSSKKWTESIVECLQESDKTGATSIAFPALGTGNLNINPKEMSKYILEAVGSYLSQNQNTNLRMIDLVIFQPNMVQDFVKAMQSALQEKQKSFFASASDWLSNKFNFVFGGRRSGDNTRGTSRGGQGLSPSGVASPIREDMVKLDIYAEKSSDIEKCKRELDQKLEKAMITSMWKDKATYQDDKELIRKLRQEQILQLNEESHRLHVTLDINPKSANIKIYGLPKDVSSMSDLITKELKDIDKGISERKEEELLARAVQWKYTDREGKPKNFDAFINKQLEETFSKNPAAVFKYETGDDSQAVIDMNTMTGSYKGNQFKVIRDDLSKPKVLVADMPKTWVQPHDTYQELVVTPGSPEFNQVETNFKRTIGATATQILEIRRVQNPTLYQQYVLLRKDVAKKLNRTEDQVETVPLWHGTDQDTVSKITSGKFDRGLAGKNATMYGVGSYFARDSSYSYRYAQPNPSGDRYMMQTKVITGEWAQGSQGIKAAPYKSNQIHQYDSVVDNMQGPSIYVVFHDVAAYPEYIIKFR